MKRSKLSETSDSFAKKFFNSSNWINSGVGLSVYSWPVLPPF